MTFQLAVIFAISAVFPLTFTFAQAAGQQQPATQQPTVKREVARPVQSVEGHVIYKSYCAACHGADGRGNGPAAPAMKVPPTDLTTYAQRHGGKFSEVDLRTVIEGQLEIAAHGSKDMPIWGEVFRALTSDRDVREMRMRNLIEHLRTIQQK